MVGNSVRNCVVNYEEFCGEFCGELCEELRRFEIKNCVRGF